MIHLPSDSAPYTQLIISIKQARKKLGKTSQHLSDDEIKDIVLALQALAKKHLSRKGSKNNNVLLNNRDNETI